MSAPPPPGLSGLANLGNTCFMNACLQILSHTHELDDLLRLVDKPHPRKLNPCCESSLLLEWNQLHKILWSQNCVVSPGRFLQSVQQVARETKRDLFTGYQQNDLPEFLLFLVESFHQALKREVEVTVYGSPRNDTDHLASLCFGLLQETFEKQKDYSEVWNIFYGVQVTHLVSAVDGSMRRRKPEPFFLLDLPLPAPPANVKQPASSQPPTLYDCFDAYIQRETLEGDNAWFNEATHQKEAVTKYVGFWQFPDVLVLDLKRVLGRGHQLRKNQQLVVFPPVLDLTRYVLGYKKQDYVYDLYGVANHMGSLLGGHYTAFVRHAGNGQWYHFNDNRIEAVPDAAQVVTPKAYCLFYRKRKKDGKV